MPTPAFLELAQLREIFLDKTGQVDPGRTGEVMDVQFNPESLSVKQSKSSLMGKPTSSMSVSLVFDVTVLNPLAALLGDVQDFTSKIDAFAAAKKPGPWTPGVRFLWGSFKFDGWINSIDKNFDSFAVDGTPLRATVAISISSEGIMTPRKDA